MLGFFEIRDRINFWRNADRIGPDILLTHWRLYFKSTMRSLNILARGLSLDPAHMQRHAPKLKLEMTS
jgi:hypothetical protein